MLTVAELASRLNGVWHGNANHAIFSCASLFRATNTDIACYTSHIPIHLLNTTLAGAVLVQKDHVSLCPTNAIVVDHPIISMQKLLDLFSTLNPEHAEIHQTAIIHPTAQIGSEVTIGAYAVIGAGVQLGNGVCIGANTHIDSSVHISKNCHIGSKVAIHSGSYLGEGTTLNSGTVIGAAPFNFIKEHGSWLRGSAVGGVYLGNQVYLGSNSVICRGSLTDTCIDDGVCIDNLVQIANDVRVGKNSAILACAALGAQVSIGADCIIGGASTIAPHVSLADDVVITGMSSVNKSIHKAGIYSSGTIAHDHQKWRKNASRFKRLDDYINKLKEIERKLEQV